ncbi:MAG: PQQ-dependent dehydrogenase, methanol/ethanol family [Vicinamibacteraceae bacterium]
MKRLGAWFALAFVGLALLTALAIFSSPALRWRASVVALKAAGQLTDLSWGETIRWLRPGSPVYLGSLPETGNPYRAIQNLFHSEEDRRSGAGLFIRHCAACHGRNATGGTGPGLAGVVAKPGSSDWGLFRTISRGVPGTAMPPQRLPEESVWQLVAFLRSLTAAESAPRAAGREVSRPPTPVVAGNRLLRADAEPGNWLTYSGAYHGRRHSRLTDITAANVAQLKLAWAVQLPSRGEKVETSPIVVDGTMYITEPPNIVRALDAATGQELWMYERALPDEVHACCGLVNRGVAVLDDKVYVGTLDAHLVALEAESGRVVWDVEVADYRRGYSITAAPLALPRAIVTGIAGSEFGVRGFLDAYDPTSGRRLWRFNTLPEPGKAGHDTWSGDSWETGGASTWLTGAFDPTLNLLYWGVSNPAPDFRGDDRQGDNLYSDSAIALDARTGALRWHFQFTPHDEHDWGAAQIPMLADLDVGNVRRRLLLWANRNAFYYVLDRETGNYVHGRPFARQNWAVRLDKTGRPQVRADAKPSEKGTLVYPGVTGGTNWWSPSFNPDTRLVYVPVLERPNLFFKDDTEWVEGELFLGGATQQVAHLPWYKAVRALDALSGALKWEYRLPPDDKGDMGGLLSTAGGLVFAGNNAMFYALDALTGRELWSSSLGGRIIAAPVTFEVNGRQMVTIAAGHALFTFALP